MMKAVTIAGALLGLSSVIVGATGDHLLEGKLTSETAETFAVALRYHQLYAILIFFMGLYSLNKTMGRLYTASCLSFLAGITIFSFSLYVSLRWPLGVLVYATPLGGSMLMAGWGLVLIWVIKTKSRNSRV